jgi:hypothetical protein
MPTRFLIMILELLCLWSLLRERYLSEMIANLVCGPAP